MSTRKLVLSLVLWWALFFFVSLIGPPGILEMTLFVLGIVVIVGIWALRRPRRSKTL